MPLAETLGNQGHPIEGTAMKQSAPAIHDAVLEADFVIRQTTVVRPLHACTPQRLQQQLTYQYLDLYESSGIRRPSNYSLQSTTTGLHGSECREMALSVAKRHRPALPARRASGSGRAAACALPGTCAPRSSRDHRSLEPV